MQHSTTKYVPRYIQLKQQQEREARGPIAVESKTSLVAEIPSHVRQFPVLQDAVVGGADSANAGNDPSSVKRALAKHAVEVVAQANQHLFGVSPRPARDQVESEVQKLSRHGLMPSRCQPDTYEPQDWSSVTKTEFQKIDGHKPLSKDLQIQRGRVMRSSAVVIGQRPLLDPKPTPFAKGTQMKEDYPSYPPAYYASATSYGIGTGGSVKTHSSVVTSEAAALHQAIAGQYEPTTRRQFVHPSVMQAEEDAAAVYAPSPSAAHKLTASGGKMDLKKEITASHFHIAEAPSTDYRTVASTPLPSKAPLIKNRPPSAPDRAKNPFVCHDESEARPPRASAQEISAAKMKSSVPLMGNLGPTTAATGGLGDSRASSSGNAGEQRPPSAKGQPPATIDVHHTLPRHLTATAVALPRYHAVRRRDAADALEIVTSSLVLGCDRTEYKTAAKTGHQGVFFGKVPGA